MIHINIVVLSLLSSPFNKKTERKVPVWGPHLENLNIILNKDENVHRYAVRGGKDDRETEIDRERGRDREKEEIWYAERENHCKRERENVVRITVFC